MFSSSHYIGIFRKAKGNLLTGILVSKSKKKKKLKIKQIKKNLIENKNQEKN